MTAATDLLTDGFTRVRDTVHQVLDGLAAEQLRWRPAEAANPIGWLVWHLTRVQDDHVAGVADGRQCWIADGWSARIETGHRESGVGYGDTTEQVGRVRASADQLAGYQDAVHARTIAFVTTLSDDELARVVDQSWDPPVTLAVRLVSVLDDATQHAGQAAYVRGLLDHS